MIRSGHTIRWLIGIVAVGLALDARADLHRGEEVNGVIVYQQKPLVVDATATPHSRKHDSRKKHRSRVLSKPVHLVNHRAQRAAHEQARVEAKQQRHCEHLHHQLDAIERSLRAGYREPRGNQLRSRQRQLEGQIFDSCD